jgi:hypothetical protein
MVDNIQCDREETGKEGENVQWIYLVCDKVTWQTVVDVPVIMNHWVM